jgi:protein associated with RNAse G/E
MCKINYLKRTKDGILLFCKTSEMYQLLFKNINFNLTQMEFDCLSSYIKNIDEHYWMEEYRYSIYNKNIPIPLLQDNLMILLDLNDLIELRELLNYKSHSIRFITFREIDYNVMLN